MRCIFLDRDGTINIDKGYSNRIEDLHLIEGVSESLHRIKRFGFYLVVVSNQAGVSLGYHTIEDVERFNAEIQRKLGSVIDAFYFCPHGKEDNCDCRKPATGLIKKACEKLKIDLELSYVIGDKSTDIELGKKVGCKTILVLTGHGKEEITKSSPDYVAEDINYAIRIIENEIKDEIIPVYGELEYSGEKIKVSGIIDRKIKGVFKKWNGTIKIEIPDGVQISDNNLGRISNDGKNVILKDIEQIRDLAVDFILGLG